MKAIEINSKTDKKGRLKIDCELERFNKNVRVLILFDDEEQKEEMDWINSVAKSPAFDFLNDPEENIYSLKDGQPFNEETRLPDGQVQ